MSIRLSENKSTEYYKTVRNNYICPGCGEFVKKHQCLKRFNRKKEKYEIVCQGCYFKKRKEQDNG